MNILSGREEGVSLPLSQRVRDTSRMEKAHPYKPSAYYFRQGLRSAETIEEAVQIGMHLVSELEQLKQFCRDEGLVPPKWNIMQTEIDEKDWGDVVQFRISG